MLKILFLIGLCLGLKQFNLDNCKDKGYDVYECFGSGGDFYTLSNNNAMISMKRLTVVGDVAGVNVKNAEGLERIVFKDVTVLCDSIRNARTVVIDAMGSSYTCQVNIILNEL